MKKILSLIILLSLGLVFADDSGVLDQGPFKGAGMAGPQKSSRMYLVETGVQGGSADVELAIDTPEEAMIMVVGEEESLMYNENNVLQESLTLNEGQSPAGKRSGVFKLNKRKAGKRQFSFRGLKNQEKAHILVVQPKSSLSLDVMLKPLAARTGDSVKILARINDAKSPKTAILEAKVGGLVSVTLNDRGQGADAMAGDGLYTGIFTAPDVDGFETVKVEVLAHGKSYGSRDYQRSLSTEVLVTKAVTGIEGGRIESENGKIRVPISASKGDFRLSVVFGYEDKSLAYVNKSVTMKGKAQEMVIQIPEAGLAADRAVVRVLNMKTMGLEDEMEISLKPVKALRLMGTEEKTPELPESKARALQMFGE